MYLKRIEKFVYRKLKSKSNTETRCHVYKKTNKLENSEAYIIILVEKILKMINEKYDYQNVLNKTDLK